MLHYPTNCGLCHKIAFNDALTAALRELYDRAHRIWNSIKENEDFKDAEIEAKLCV